MSPLLSCLILWAQYRPLPQLQSLSRRSVKRFGSFITHSTQWLIIAMGPDLPLQDNSLNVTVAVNALVDISSGLPAVLPGSNSTVSLSVSFNGTPVPNAEVVVIGGEAQRQSLMHLPIILPYALSTILYFLFLTLHSYISASPLPPSIS
jgi:hypothetical protein